MIIKMQLRRLINKISLVIGAEKTLKLEAMIRFKKKINIDCPKTLSDKICYLEFRTDNPLVIQCSDKYEVRNYVKYKGYSNILVPLIGTYYEDADQIDFDNLPNKFVIKATYGCQMNLICSDKSHLDIENTRKMINNWLKNGFNRDAIEPHYKKIPHRVICEKYLENDDSIIDYKIHCFNGIPIFILTCSNRNEALRLNLYDLDWNPIHKIQGKYKNDNEIEKPSELEKMLSISRKLAEDFDFVRVDLYQIGKKIFFGELTFTPDGGMLSYFTKEFDLEMGERLKLGGKNH